MSDEERRTVILSALLERALQGDGVSLAWYGYLTTAENKDAAWAEFKAVMQRFIDALSTFYQENKAVILANQ